MITNCGSLKPGPYTRKQQRGALDWQYCRDDILFMENEIEAIDKAVTHIADAERQCKDFCIQAQLRKPPVGGSRSGTLKERWAQKALDFKNKLLQQLFYVLLRSSHAGDLSDRIREHTLSPWPVNEVIVRQWKDEAVEIHNQINFLMRRCFRNQYEAKTLFLKARANFIRMVQDDVCRIEEVPVGHRLGPQCSCQLCCLATPTRM